jgi:archaeosine-15-forming tRNA-guanine transglycosylase
VVAAVMAAARALVGLTAESITRVDDVVTVPQLRVLVLTSTVLSACRPAIDAP